jgi:hypothetical protein
MNNKNTTPKLHKFLCIVYGSIHFGKFSTGRCQGRIQGEEWGAQSKEKEMGGGGPELKKKNTAYIFFFWNWGGTMATTGPPLNPSLVGANMLTSK